MIKREDFYRILLETLLEYFSVVRHKEITCQYDSFDGGEELRIFTKGNVVCRPQKPKGARNFFNAEYNIRNSLWKYIIGKILVNYLMCTKKAFAIRSLYITDGVLGKNEFISPQNRSIRIYDYDKSHVDCIIKKGFTNKFFNNQIAFRKNYKYDFLVPLIDCGDGWFREPILKGHPLVRVTGKRKFQQGMNTAVKDIQELAKDTLEYKPLQEYIYGLLIKAQQLTEQAKQAKDVASYDKCLELIAFVENGVQCVSMEIPTCISHGDFQTGNIWMNNDGTVLIYDWETSGRRSVWYDITTLLYSLRRVFGWEQFLNDEKPSQSLACDPNKNRSCDEFEVIKKIVLLEDYLFYIEDLMELPMDWGKDVFDENIQRIYQVVIAKNSI